MGPRVVRDFLLPFLAGLLVGLLGFAQGQALDLLALQKPGFPARAFAEKLPEGAAVGSLDWTFGTSLRPVESLLRTGRVSAYRVHLFNGPCLRNRICGRYEPHAGRTVRGFSDAWERGGRGPLRRHLARRTKAYCALFARHPGTQLLISPTLEHNLSRKAFRRQAAVVREACPAATVVDNPVGGVAATPGFVTERHGRRLSLKAPCVVSLDGETGAVDLGRFVADHRQCLSFLWTSPLNCRRTAGPFVDPRSRPASDCPGPGEVARLLAAL